MRKLSIVMEHRGGGLRRPTRRLRHDIRPAPARGRTKGAPGPTSVLNLSVAASFMTCCASAPNPGTRAQVFAMFDATGEIVVTRAKQLEHGAAGTAIAFLIVRVEAQTGPLVPRPNVAGVEFRRPFEHCLALVPLRAAGIEDAQVVIILAPGGVQPDLFAVPRRLIRQFRRSERCSLSSLGDLSLLGCRVTRRLHPCQPDRGRDDAGDEPQYEQRQGRQRRPCSAGRTCGSGNAPTAGTPAPPRRPGNAARPSRSRWPSRSAGRGPSPAPSSRSSPARRCTRPLSFFGSSPRLAAMLGNCSRRAQPRARPRRLLLANHPQHLQQRRLHRPACAPAASCRSAARTAARPASRCRCACRRRAGSPPPAPGDMYSSVPITSPKPVNIVRSVSCCPVALATPKSITFGTGLPSYSATSTFVGLRSRWMIPFWWACCTAWQTCTNSSSRCRGVEAVLVAVLRDRHALDQLHHEVRPAGVGHAGVEDLGDVRVVHQRQRLPLGLEAGDHLPRVHPRLDDLQRDLALDRRGLLGHEDRAVAALADRLEQLVAADHGAGRHRASAGRIDRRRWAASKKVVAAASCARRSDSTAARSSALPAHASSRYAPRCSAGRFAAASKTSSNLGWVVAIATVIPSQCDGRGRRASEMISRPRESASAEFAEEPRPGEGPVPVRRRRRQAQDVGRLVGRQAGEVAQLHQLRLHRVELEPAGPVPRPARGRR